MDCEKAELTMLKSLEEDLTDSEQYCINTHVKNCDSCQQFFENVQNALLDKNKEQMDFVNDDFFNESVMKQIRKLNKTKDKILTVIFEFIQSCIMKIKYRIRYN